jgi:hypothetical protein
MCGPQFCSMKITQDIRAEVLAMQSTDRQVVKKGMQEKSAEFLGGGRREALRRGRAGGIGRAFPSSASREQSLPRT